MKKKKKRATDKSLKNVSSQLLLTGRKPTQRLCMRRHVCVETLQIVWNMNKDVYINL